MATPIPYSTRLKIVKLRQGGQSYAKIAKAVGYSADGVRKIWQRYEAKGYEGLKTSYENSGIRSPYSEIKELVAQEKTGDQGAPYIRSLLLSLHPDKVIPHERTIQRWWEAERGKKKPGNLKQTD
jgi:transposase